MNAKEIAEVITEFLIEEKDFIFPVILENDKETLQEEIFHELTEI